MDKSGKDPEKEIRELMNKVWPISNIIVHFEEGTPIIRGRPKKPSDKFETKSDYSFKPQESNNSYQRASTPYKTMFYGVVPNTIDISKISSDELTGMRTSIFCELFHKGIDLKETPKISFGRWKVKKGEKINVLAIIQEEKYKGSNVLLDKLKMAYDCFVNQNKDENIKNKSLNFGTYLANEFSKDKISNESDYMISAIFSEIVSKRKQFDGILYPSVRTGGEYFNVAINPDVVNSKLELTDVGECPILKIKDKFHVCKSDFGANNLQGKESFKLSPTNR